jgi:hypothetical protein
MATPADSRRRCTPRRGGSELTGGIGRVAVTASAADAGAAACPRFLLRAGSNPHMLRRPLPKATSLV